MLQNVQTKYAANKVIDLLKNDLHLGMIWLVSCPLQDPLQND